MNKDWIRTTCRDLQLYYNPKVGNKLRMDTSTNALGANPAGQRELVECTKLNVGQYPNTYGDNLRDELARLYGMKADNFVVGNGSDEVLDIIMKTFVEPGETVITAHPAYVLHSFFVKINAGRTVTVDLNDEFQLDVEKINSTQGKLVLLCTPNNPTANTFRTYFAPADFNETANTLGLPLYAKQEPRKFGRGTDLHTQSNPLPICLRPEVLVKGTKA